VKGNKLRKKIGEQGNWVRILFVLYILIVIKVIIFKYPYEELRAIASSWRRDVILEGLGTANFTPFKTIKMYIDYAYKLNSVENLAGNVLVFVPFGFLFPFVAREGERFFVMFVNAFVFILGIEVFQLFSAFGAFDVDDILLNCLGAAMGYGIYRIFMIWQKREGKVADGKDT
jgi:glycopeptide antibiotics resistance protein